MPHRLTSILKQTSAINVSGSICPCASRLWALISGREITPDREITSEHQDLPPVSLGQRVAALQPTYSFLCKLARAARQEGGLLRPGE